MNDIIYQCRLTPTLDILDELILTISAKDKIKKDVRTLDKWFYFYVNDPSDLILIKFTKFTNYFAILELGANRYRGVAFRGKKSEIKGYLVTDTENLNDLPTDIKIDGFGDKETLKGIYRRSFQNFWDDWADVFDWISKNLKFTWGLEFEKKTFFLNNTPSREIKEIIKVDDHPTFESAIQYLFKKVVELEFNSLAE